jgi:Phytanoyl-CoA dioxygenase (PhyH)
MLTDKQRAQFEQLGVVRLNGVFSEADAKWMLERLWDSLTEQYGIQRGEPATWALKQPTGFQSLTRLGVFDALGGSVLLGTLDAVLGEGAWERPLHWGVPLVTFPDHASHWHVPGRQWHLDFPARGRSQQLPGVRVLAFVAAVEPAGGGTVVVTGSHRLVERLVATGQARDGHSARVRDSLAASHPWLRSLWCGGADTQDRVARFMAEGECIGDIPVRVAELTGAPGDVILMHPWTFHAPAPNCGQTPRFMISHSVFRNTAAAA